MDRYTRSQYLEAMGIQGWRLRDAPVADAPEAQMEAALLDDAPAVIAPPAPPPPAADEGAQWTLLEQTIRDCSRCALHQQRIQAVPGVGGRDADWLVIGEAPGADEDEQGEPFVGPAGQLLDQMLRAIGLQREQVYITNVVKCHPPGNRDPKPGEAAACRGYLERQIGLVRPRVILALGRVAAQSLLHSDEPVAGLRGRRLTFGEQAIPLVVTYHPAYLLRSPAEKRNAWQDLLLARRLVSGAE